MAVVINNTTGQQTRAHYALGRPLELFETKTAALDAAAQHYKGDAKVYFNAEECLISVEDKTAAAAEEEEPADAV